MKITQLDLESRKFTLAFESLEEFYVVYLAAKQSHLDLEQWVNRAFSSKRTMSTLSLGDPIELVEGAMLFQAEIDTLINECIDAMFKRRDGPENLLATKLDELAQVSEDQGENWATVKERCK